VTPKEKTVAKKSSASSLKSFRTKKKSFKDDTPSALPTLRKSDEIRSTRQYSSQQVQKMRLLWKKLYRLKPDSKNGQLEKKLSDDHKMYTFPID
jgi:hypothetical protein